MYFLISIILFFVYNIDILSTFSIDTELNHCSFGYESLNIVKESKSSNTGE